MRSEIKKIEQKYLKDEVAGFAAGDTVAVHFIVREGERERTQIFTGVVLRRRGGGIRESFTVRKVSFGIGVERTFPVHSPLIKQVDVTKKGRVRRAFLSYTRRKKGK